MAKTPSLEIYLEALGKHSLRNGRNLRRTDIQEIGAKILRSEILGEKSRRIFLSEDLAREFKEVKLTPTIQEGRNLVGRIYLEEADCGRKGYIFFEKTGDRVLMGYSSYN